MWGVLCALISSAILAALIASMQSCSDGYDIGPQGQLYRTGSEPSPPSPSSAPRVACSWSTEFPQFPKLERGVLPGDHLVRTKITAGIWKVEVQMWRVEVLRNNESFILAREGHVRFWATILVLSLFPIICWGIGALWMGCSGGGEAASRLSEKPRTFWKSANQAEYRGRFPESPS
jgi:hypothetical protein